MESKLEIINKFKNSDNDTGGSEVQVALFTNRINQLNEHCKKHKKDNHSRRGLIVLVNKRKKLLSYLKKTNNKRYTDLLAKTGLRK